MFINLKHHTRVSSYTIIRGVDGKCNVPALISDNYRTIVIFMSGKTRIETLCMEFQIRTRTLA